MAYNIPDGSVLEIRLRATFNSQQVMNVFHYRNADTCPDGAASAAQVATQFNLSVWSILQPVLTEALLSVKIDAQWVHPIRYRVVTQDADPAAGAAAGGSLPTGVATVIRRFGEQANRHNQGRIFVFGVPLTKVSGSQLTQTFLDDNKVLFENISVTSLQDDNAVQFEPCLWSSATPTERIPVVGGFLDPVVRYQRRRELGVGQ